MAEHDGESPYRDIGPSKPELLEYRVKELERRDRDERAELKSFRVEFELLKERVLGMEMANEVNERNIGKQQRHAEWTVSQWIIIGTTFLLVFATFLTAIFHK
jgi:hypothetical protein